VYIQSPEPALPSLNKQQVQLQDGIPMSKRQLMPSVARWQVLVDFDGTIAPDDPTDTLLARFAEPQWRVVEAAWQSGQISSLDCMRRQAELLRATPEQLDAAIRATRLDPGFEAFLSFCRQVKADVKIVSDGFDRVIGTALKKAGLSVPYFANRLEWRGGDRWRLSFPHSQAGCRVGSANCKCSHGQWLATPRIVVGDGRSDFCMASRADFVIAKGALARHCRKNGLEHATFGDFDEVTVHLAEWLATTGRALLKQSRTYATPQSSPALDR
jgi:2-hydroxy-3-keto-5-methylthiopentenyl-1-phosphate phosphatase